MTGVTAKEQQYLEHQLIVHRQKLNELFSIINRTVIVGKAVSKDEKQLENFKVYFQN